MATDKRLTRALLAFAIAATSITCAVAAPSYFEVSRGSHPHDVAAAPGSGAPVYYTAQRTGKLGILDPKTGKYEEIALGPRSAPHGVIVGPDGAPWITDGGQNAIVRLDPKTHEVKVWALPPETGHANLNTLTFDKKGRVWFTAMGHREDVWTNPIFQDILVGGIKWALGEVNADVPANLKETAPEAYTNPPFPEPKPASAAK